MKEHVMKRDKEGLCCVICGAWDTDSDFTAECTGSVVTQEVIDKLVEPVTPDRTPAPAQAGAGEFMVWIAVGPSGKIVSASRERYPSDGREQHVSREQFAREFGRPDSVVLLVPGPVTLGGQVPAKHLTAALRLLAQQPAAQAQAPAEAGQLEVVSAAVHDEWMEEQRRRGRTSSVGRDGEEYMVPYSELSEAAKELDRVTVRAVLKHVAQPVAPAEENKRLREALTEALPVLDAVLARRRVLDNMAGPTMGRHPMQDEYNSAEAALGRLVRSPIRFSMMIDRARAALAAAEAGTEAGA